VGMPGIAGSPGPRGPTGEYMNTLIMSGQLSIAAASEVEAQCADQQPASGCRNAESDAMTKLTTVKNFLGVPTPSGVSATETNLGQHLSSIISTALGDLNTTGSAAVNLLQLENNLGEGYSQVLKMFGTTCSGELWFASEVAAFQAWYGSAEAIVAGA